MAVNAKLSVFPSFHPSREKMPISFVISCSQLIPNPYFSDLIHALKAYLK
jgi:hypothetical protein